MLCTRRVLATFVFLTLAVAAPVAVAQPATTATPQPSQNGLTSELRARIEERISKAMTERGIPGLLLAIGINGELAWTAGFGFADVENSVPASPDTVYRLASISKPIAAVAALQLMEAGTLDIDASVRTYVPEFPEKAHIVTVRQLLCHQGGVRHYRRPGEINSTRRYVNVMSAIDQFKDDDLLSEPGTKYTYSTFGYVLAGAAVERAGAKPFMEQVRERIAIPCGADGLRADDSLAIIPHRARGYAKADDGTIENCRLADTSNKIPGGGMCARPQDLVRFALALARGELLKPQTIEMMWTAVPLRDSSKTGYGLGWSISEVGGLKRVDHSGAQPGVSTSLILFPKEKLAIAVMSNLEDSQATQLAAALAELVLAENSK